MMETTAGTSSEKDVNFDEAYIRNARHMPVEQLMEELIKLKADDHVLLRTVRRNIAKEREIQEDRIKRHRYRAENKVENDYKTKAEEIEKAYEKRIAELKIEAEKRCEEFERSVAADFQFIDINKPQAQQPTFETNKKTLRGRGQPIEVPTYLNANQTVRLPDTTYNCAFDDYRIRNDIEKISNSASDSRRLMKHIVSIQKPKLIIGKISYKQGEDVYAENAHFGEVHARIEMIGEKNVVLKGTQLWDTRQIDASLEDLEDGRVKLSKLRGKDSKP